MVKVEASTQIGSDAQLRWQKDLPLDREVTLGRVAGQSDWAAEWDDQISRRHAKLNWNASTGLLHVQVLPNARNPTFCDGRRFGAGEEFDVQMGHRFIIGETVFSLVYIPDPTPPAESFTERTCGADEVRSLPYVDADKRIEVLSALPELIRHSASDAEFEQHVVDVLLQGVPRAQFAALVRIDPNFASPTTEVHVQREARRAGFMDSLKPSRRLVYSAIYRYFKAVMHRWGDKADSSSDFHNQPSLGVEQWAVCAPLADDAAPGWALYAAGAEVEQPGFMGPTSGQLENGDIKFVATVAEMVGALRALRELQKRQVVLSRFFSRAVIEALAGQDMELVLKPRVCDVTVMCCDLRGSSRIAEEGESDLAATCERVSAALQEMTTWITSADGVISDFQGDAAMSFWGWPQKRDTDAEHAARAALEINRGFKLKAAKPGNPLAGFACGLGLATGPGVAGMLGTIDQFKIGVFGPTINLAARLEGLTKVFKVPVVADDATAQRLKGKSQFRLRRIAQVRPYGMAKHLLIHEILSPVGVADVGSISESQRLNYEAALDRFIAGEWTKAEGLLDKVSLQNDGPSKFLLNYIRERQSRPPGDWAGVIAMVGK